MQIVSRLTVVSHLALAMAAGAVAAFGAVPEVQAQAGAGERAKARDQYNKGTAAFEGGDYQAAAEAFKKADAAMPSPHAKFWIAASLDKAGRSEEAVAAYRVLLDDPDAGKVGEERLAEARGRIVALTPAPAPVPDPVYAADEAAGVEQPAPIDVEPEPEVGQSAIDRDLAPPPAEAEPKPYMQKLKPSDHMFEIGPFAGVIIVSRKHNLQQGEADPHLYYNAPAFIAGARAGYYPTAFLGFEGEYGLGLGSVDAPEGDVSARLMTYHGQVVLQLPAWRMVPFVTLGAGGISVKSDELGKDNDTALRVGLGGKLAVADTVLFRLDLGGEITQRQGGEFQDGVTLHPEILLGVSLALGREASSQ